MFMTLANLLFMSSNTIFICVVTHKSHICCYQCVYIHLDLVDPFNGFVAYARNAFFSTVEKISFILFFQRKTHTVWLSLKIYKQKKKSENKKRKTRKNIERSHFKLFVHSHFFFISLGQTLIHNVHVDDFMCAGVFKWVNKYNESTQT